MPASLGLISRRTDAQAYVPVAHCTSTSHQHGSNRALRTAWSCCQAGNWTLLNRTRHNIAVLHLTGSGRIYLGDCRDLIHCAHVGLMGASLSCVVACYRVIGYSARHLNDDIQRMSDIKSCRHNVPYEQPKWLGKLAWCLTTTFGGFLTLYTEFRR
jgi:hypothetical protein